MARQYHNLPVRRRGSVTMYVAVIFVALGALISLGVDYGRTQLAKSQLAAAVDAAARAAASGLGTSPAAGRTSAIAIAAANNCDGTPVTIASTDIAYGTWDNTARTFTTLSGAAESGANAARVTASRSVELIFARLVGQNTCQVTASATARVTFSNKSGFMGLGSMITAIGLKNNAFFASYNSSVTTNPNQSNASSNVLVGSNGIVDPKNNTEIRGDVQLGPGGSVSGSMTVTGSTTTLSTALPTPTSPAWSPGTNPGGISRTYTVNSTTTLPGGTYWFTSLRLNANLSFSGPATVYINGNVIIDANLTASGSIPSNLKIYQIGSSRTFGDSKTNNVTITAQIESPGGALVMKNNLVFRGSGLFKSIDLKNNGEFYYDEAAGPAKGGASVVLVR